MSFRTALFIGDSLIEYFDWQRRFPDLKVYNLGRAGETVEGLLVRVDSITRRYPGVDMLFLMSGINNVAMNDTGFLDAYREIISGLAAAYPGAYIYVLSLLPTRLDWIPDETIRGVNSSLREIASGEGAVFIDIYASFIGPEGNVKEGYLMSDGVHLSVAGYEAWAGVLEGIIGEK